MRIGQPTPPKRSNLIGHGTIELRAGTWRAMVMTPPPGRPRDACVGFGEERDVAEWDVICDVSVAGGGAVGFVDNWRETVVVGVAPPDVRAVRVNGRRLPLSAHRGFLAVFPKAPARLASDLANGRTVSFRLRQLRPHRHRRPGAVFNDEVGEATLRLTRREVERRFGAPVATRGGCSYYELVGYANDGWEFCFDPDGRMEGAAGRKPPS